MTGTGGITYKHVHLKVDEGNFTTLLSIANTDFNITRN